MPLTRREMIACIGLLGAGLAPARAVPIRPRGGGAAPMACTPITSDSQITGPGVYCLTADVVGDFNVTTYSNVEVQGNNHTVSGILTVGNGDATAGVFVHDLITGGFQVFGSISHTLAPPNAHVKSLTALGTVGDVSAAIAGSNVLVESCTFLGNASTTDDPCQLWTGNPNSYCTFDGCTFGANFDTGFEGIGSWDHVTVNNCTAQQNGMGGFYGGSDHSVFNFTFTNCTFTGNTLFNWYFPNVAQTGLQPLFSDAAATTRWGSLGNVFSGNTYR